MPSKRCFNLEYFSPSSFTRFPRRTRPCIFRRQSFRLLFRHQFAAFDAAVRIFRVMLKVCRAIKRAFAPRAEQILDFIFRIKNHNFARHFLRHRAARMRPVDHQIYANNPARRDDAGRISPADELLFDSSPLSSADPETLNVPHRP